MKVVFLENRLRTDKLGIMYLARILKDAGHDVDLVQAHRDVIPKADYIMCSVMSGEHEWFFNKLAELKSKRDFVSVVGGPHFTFFPESGLKNSNIDYVVIGPGESVILDIVNGVYQGKKLIRGNLPDVNSLAHPYRQIQYKYDEFGKARMKRFIAGRYCLYSCTYCFNHLFKKLYQDQKKDFFQRVSPELMIEEILEVKKDYGLELVYFNDDDLAASYEWLEEFCKLIKQTKLQYCGSVRANSIDGYKIDMLANSGCVFLNIALESAVPETQKLLRRGFITNSQISDATKTCEERGIKVRLQNMIGLPVENPLEDALKTLEMNMKLNPTDSWASIFQPFPRTDLWKYCLDKGLITEDTQAQAFYEHTPLNIPDADKINRLHKWWFFAVKYQWPIELVKILLDTPLSKDQEERIQNYRWEVAKNLLYGM